MRNSVNRTFPDERLWELESAVRSQMTPAKGRPQRCSCTDEPQPRSNRSLNHCRRRFSASRSVDNGSTTAPQPLGDGHEAQGIALANATNITPSRLSAVTACGHSPRHRHLGHLKDDGLRVVDHFGPDLDEFLPLRPSSAANSGPDSVTGRHRWQKNRELSPFCRPFCPVPIRETRTRRPGVTAWRNNGLFVPMGSS
jgi:hypothetical protein